MHYQDMAHARVSIEIDWKLTRFQFWSLGLGPELLRYDKYGGKWKKQIDAHH